MRMFVVNTVSGMYGKKTYRNHRNLHFRGHNRDRQLDDLSIVQESNDSGLLLQVHVNGIKCALVL